MGPRVKPARLEKSAAAAAHLDLGETMAVEVAAQRRNDVVDIRSNHIAQLAMGARLARNGVDRTLRRSGDKGQHLKAVLPEDAFGRGELGFPQS